MMPLLQVDHLNVEFHTAVGVAQAVRDLSFSVEKGEILGIVGESGSGKSVTSLTIMGLLEETACVSGGTILFQGRDLLKMTEKELCTFRGKDMTMIFQEPAMALNPVVKVRKQLQEVYRYHLPERMKASRRELIELLEKLNIPDAEQVLEKYPFELSGGLKQRIMIAMAMLSRPELLIADEPTTALDVTTQSEILELIRVMQRETGCAVILITHDLGVIAEMADRVLVMYRGQMVEEKRAEDFFRAAEHPYSQDLLRARPRSFDGRFYSIPGAIPNAYQPLVGCGYCARCNRRTARCETETPELRASATGRLRCHEAGR